MSHYNHLSIEEREKSRVMLEQGISICKKVKHFWHKAYNIILIIVYHIFLTIYAGNPIYC